MDNLRQQEENRRSTFNTLLAAVCILLCAIILKAFVLTNFITVGDSMLPTYHDGEIIWVYRTNSVKRGDVVVLRDDRAGVVLIKRVVAKKGDRLRAVEDNYGKYYFEILRQGESEWVKESYDGVNLPSVTLFQLGSTATQERLLSRHETDPLQDGLLITDDYFVMGDNRPLSSDSRTRGCFNASVLIGIVFAP